MSEFDQLYREVILDHYKNPRGHGLLEHADAQAEGQNPLCGDEVSIYVAFEDDGGCDPAARRAARRDRNPADADPAQVRVARPVDVEARAAQGEGHAAAGG